MIMFDVEILLKYISDYSLKEIRFKDDYFTSMISINEIFDKGNVKNMVLLLGSRSFFNGGFCRNSFREIFYLIFRD